LKTNKTKIIALAFAKLKSLHRIIKKQ